MPTPAGTIRNILLSVLPKDQWVLIQTIYDTVESNISQFADDDFAPEAPGSEHPKWKRNVRNELQRLKERGDILWKAKGSYLFPSETYRLNQSSSLPQRRGISEERFRQIQARREEIGRLGEEFVVEYEREQLRRIGRNDLAEQIIRVSENDIGLGYDVLSFDEKGGEKFIEVKTTVGTGWTFELSANELAIAEELGERYWIYFIRQFGGDVDNLAPIALQNPFNSIGTTMELAPSSYIVRISR